MGLQKGSGRIRVVVLMRARAGEEAAFARAWQPHGAVCRAEPGCLQYELYQSTMDATRFTLLELWSDQAAYDAHWERERHRDMPHRVHAAERVQRVGEGGVEFFFDHCLWTVGEDGRWQPRPD